MTAVFILRIFRGQQDLGGMDAIFRKNFVVNMHQLTLSYGSGSLLHTQGFGTLWQA